MEISPLPWFAAEMDRDMTELAAARAKDATDFFTPAAYTQGCKAREERVVLRWLFISIW